MIDFKKIDNIDDNIEIYNFDINREEKTIVATFNMEFLGEQFIDVTEKIILLALSDYSNIIIETDKNIREKIEAIKVSIGNKHKNFWVL